MASYDEWNQGKVKISGSEENKAYDLLQQIISVHQEQVKQFAQLINVSKVDSFYKREMETVEEYQKRKDALTEESTRDGMESAVKTNQ